MRFDDDNETAARRLKQAVPEMVKRQIPVTPVNFALWYTFVAGLEPRLREELIASFPQPGLYNAEKSQQLFYQYIIKPLMPEQEEARAQVMQLLSALLETVASNLDGGRQYGETLAHGLQTLEDSSNQREIERTVQALIKATQEASADSAAFQQELDRAQRQLHSLQSEQADETLDAFTDPLTRIGNRRHFDYSLQQHIQRSGIRVSVMLIDIDHFNKFNATHGKGAGDMALQAVAELLRGYDGEDVAVARYDGAVFSLVLAGHVLEDALAIAESIRRRINGLEIALGTKQLKGALSASFGVAERHVGESVKRLIQRTEQALLQAKEYGRNRVRGAA